MKHKTFFSGNFESIEDIAKEFEDKSIIDQLKKAIIYWAIYDCDSYEGSANIVYKLNGKLYEVNAYHCSCNGLSGGWDPEQTIWECLSMRGYIKQDKSLMKIIEKESKNDL